MNFMKSLAVASVAALCAIGSADAASIVTSNPNDASFYRVSIDPKYFNYDYDFVSVNSGSPINVQTDDFWTDSSQLWIVGADNVGSLHTFDLDPLPSLISIDLQQISGAQQRYDYRYYYGSTTAATPVQSVWLPIQTQSFAPVPEPATALLGLLGVAACLSMRKR